MAPKRMTQKEDRNTNSKGRMDLVVAQMLNLLQQQMVVITQQQQQQQQQTPPTVAFKSFQVVKPPEFKCSADPIEERAWLKEIEKTFALVKVRENQKTKFASYFLKGKENYRWESKKALE